MGHSCSIERRKKLSEANNKRIAEGRHNWWRGGAYTGTRNAPEGQAWKMRVRSRDGGHSCELCGLVFDRTWSRPKECHAPGAKVAAHLIPYANGNAPLRTDPANGLLLCGECHHGLDHGPRWYFALCCSLIHWEEAENPRLLLEALTEAAENYKGVPR